MRKKSRQQKCGYTNKYIRFPGLERFRDATSVTSATSQGRTPKSKKPSECYYSTFSIKWEFDKMGICPIFSLESLQIGSKWEFLIQRAVFFWKCCHFILNKMGFSQNFSEFPSTRNENGIPFYRECNVVFLVGEQIPLVACSVFSGLFISVQKRPIDSICITTQCPSLIVGHFFYGKCPKPPSNPSF